jgi:hypothetical protein
VRPRLSCTRCDRILQEPAPNRSIDRGLAGPGLLAHVLVSKYADHLPLYRQSEIYERQGVELDRSTSTEREFVAGHPMNAVRSATRKSDHYWIHCTPGCKHRYRNFRESRRWLWPSITRLAVGRSYSDTATTAGSRLTTTPRNARCVRLRSGVKTISLQDQLGVDQFGLLLHGKAECLESIGRGPRSAAGSNTLIRLEVRKQP